MCSANMQDLVDEETQKVFEWQAPSSKAKASPPVPVDGVLTCGGDDSAILSIELPLPELEKTIEKHTILVTVLDRSGSMSPYWARQVVPAMNSLADIAWASEDVMTSYILTYATSTSQITLAARHEFMVRKKFFSLSNPILFPQLKPPQKGLIKISTTSLKFLENQHHFL